MLNFHNNWRTFLKESYEESFFGDKFAKFKGHAGKIVNRSISNPEKVIELNQLCDKLGFEEMGNGAFRAAYKIDEDYIIKIPDPRCESIRASLNMNMQEANNPMMTKYAKILPKFGPVHPGGWWLIVEYVNEIGSTKEYMSFFPRLRSVVKEVIPPQPNRTISKVMELIFDAICRDVGYDPELEDKGEAPPPGDLSNISTWGELMGELKYILGRDYDKYQDSNADLSEITRLATHTILTNLDESIYAIIEMSREFKISAMDFHRGNVGVTKDGKKFVIIDANTVTMEYYPEKFKAK